MAIYKPKNGDGFGASVNNGIRDPFQGHDCTLWMLNAQGQQVNKGHFTSIQLTFRNATEPYMELNQRVPRYLDGDIQIGWVAQRGMLDLNTLTETFGFQSITREGRVSRGPRFTLVFYVDAVELGQADGAGTNAQLDNLYGTTNTGNARATKGKIILLNCKLDTFAIGVQSGQKVLANQWEGLAEGYQVVTDGPLATAGTQNVKNTTGTKATNVPSIATGLDNVFGSVGNFYK